MGDSERQKGDVKKDGGRRRRKRKRLRKEGEMPRKEILHFLHYKRKDR